MLSPRGRTVFGRIRESGARTAPGLQSATSPISPRQVCGGRPRSPIRNGWSSEKQLKSWMLRGLEGDARCHEALLRAARPMLASFFSRRIRDDAAGVEDLVQEVLVAIHQRRGSYDRTRLLTPWLFAIARYKLIDHLRRAHRQEPNYGLAALPAGEGFEGVVHARMDVAALLGTLPEKQARAIRETRIGGLSVAEAARRVGIGESDVKVSAHRGIKTLAARFARTG